VSGFAFLAGGVARGRDGKLPGVRMSIRCALTLAVGSLILWPAAASATPLNARSDHVALHAYQSYLHSLVSLGPAWRRADSAYVASVSNQCPHVLKALKNARPGTFSQNALVTFGLEAGGDLDAAAYPLADSALSKLASTLAQLRWSGSGTKAAIRRFLAAEDSLVHLAPSDLCADARALAAAHGRRTTAATRQWTNKFTHRATVATQDGATFRTVIERFATPAEHGTLTKINHLLGRWDSTVQGLANSVGKRLLTALGL
jgi:hypothetical protein